MHQLAAQIFVEELLNWSLFAAVHNEIAMFLHQTPYLIAEESGEGIPLPIVKTKNRVF